MTIFNMPKGYFPCMLWGTLKYEVLRHFGKQIAQAFWKVECLLQWYKVLGLGFTGIGPPSAFGFNGNWSTVCLTWALILVKSTVFGFYTTQTISITSFFITSKYESWGGGGGAVVGLVVWYLPTYQVRQFAIYYLLNNENCPLGKWSWNFSEIWH